MQLIIQISELLIQLAPKIMEEIDNITDIEKLKELPIEHFKKAVNSLDDKIEEINEKYKLKEEGLLNK